MGGVTLTTEQRRDGAIRKIAPNLLSVGSGVNEYSGI
jgi:hypothetical protein